MDRLSYKGKTFTLCEYSKESDMNYLYRGNING